MWSFFHFFLVIHLVRQASALRLMRLVNLPCPDDPPAAPAPNQREGHRRQRRLQGTPPLTHRARSAARPLGRHGEGTGRIAVWNCTHGRKGAPLTPLPAGGEPLRAGSVRRDLERGSDFALIQCLSMRFLSLIEVLAHNSSNINKHVGSLAEGLQAIFCSIFSRPPSPAAPSWRCR